MNEMSVAIRTLKTALSVFQKRRRDKILRALEDGGLKVNSSEVKSDEFISTYLATEHALMKASSHQKFNLLIQLFLQGANSGRINREPDAYQEVLSLLDELSEREIKLLVKVYQYETDFGVADAQLSRSNNHQIDYLIDATGLERDLVIALLVRLRRTGLLITWGEKNESVDLALTGIETMCISPLAQEIKSWVLGAVHGDLLT